MPETFHAHSFAFTVSWWSGVVLVSSKILKTFRVSQPFVSRPHLCQWRQLPVPITVQSYCNASGLWWLPRASARGLGSLGP